MAGSKRKDSKGRLLRVGEGQNPDGRYFYKFTDRVSGKRKTVYSLSLPELREKEAKIQEDLRDGIDGSKAKMTLNQLFELYLSTKTDLRPQTRQNYVSMWQSLVKDDIGVLKIEKIKQMHVKNFYAGLVRAGYSASTIKLLHNLIFPCLEMAVSSDILRKNPARDAKIGIGGTRKEKQALTPEQQSNLLDFIREHERFSRWHPMISFMLQTGARYGEVIGLKWSDVELNTVKIERQQIYKNVGDGCKFHVCDLKTTSGRRVIPLTEQAKASLTEQKKLLLLFGRRSSDGWIFTNTQGNSITPAAFNSVLNQITRVYNNETSGEPLPHISAHILRHTFCSRAAEAGLSPKVLQTIMGHSDISVTMDTYTHLSNDFIQQETLEKLDRAVNS